MAVVIVLNVSSHHNNKKKKNMLGVVALQPTIRLLPSTPVPATKTRTMPLQHRRMMDYEDSVNYNDDDEMTTMGQLNEAERRQQQEVQFVPSTFQESFQLREVLSTTTTTTRSHFIRQTSSITTLLLTSLTVVTQSSKMTAAFAFEGGVGGLGKTKPETGCKLFDDTLVPVQNDKGIITAEIQSVTGKPVLVQFQTPWPLLSTSGGLEARDLTSSESAFVQVVSTPQTGDWRNNKKIFQQLLLDTVFASKGKYGAYGTPSDVRVKAPNDTVQDYYVVTFTTLTPAMRESERQVYIKAQEVYGNTLILLVGGTTRAKFPSNEKVFQKVMGSFQAVAGPESNLRGSSRRVGDV